MSRLIQRLEHLFLHLIDSRKLHANYIQHSRAQGFARFMSILKTSQEKPRDFWFHHLEPQKVMKFLENLGRFPSLGPHQDLQPPKQILGRYEKCRFLGHEYPIQNHQTLQPHSMARGEPPTLGKFFIGRPHPHMLKTNKRSVPSKERGHLIHLTG